MTLVNLETRGGKVFRGRVGNQLLPCYGYVYGERSHGALTNFICKIKQLAVDGIVGFVESHARAHDFASRTHSQFGVVCDSISLTEVTKHRRGATLCTS